jgi:recombinational DNA repair protein RecT
MQRAAALKTTGGKKQGRPVELMSTMVAERPATPQPQKSQSAVAVFRDRLITREDELAVALEGTGITTKRFIRAAVTAVMVEPDLLECTFQSLWLALLEACRDQLLPDRRQGAIVAYGREAKWIPMVWGLVNRCQLSTYACALMKNGAFYITEITEEGMAPIRAMSRARREDAPWNKWPDQMKQKSALKRLCKLLPLPPDIDELMQRDDDDAPSIAPEAPAAALPRPRGATEALQQFAGEPEPVELSREHERDHERVADEALGPEHQEGVAPAPSPEPEPGRPEADALPQTGAATTEAPKVSRVMLETAHERGKAARAEGLQRRALPGEYREPTRGQEAVAWRRGWDGEPLDGSGS